MQLGNILAGATESVRSAPVKFRVLGDSPEGGQVSAQAEAIMVFVSEDAREKYRQKAREWLESHDYKGKPVPAIVLDEEENRWFLMAALRDKDDPSRAFCPEAQYELFRKALIAQQMTYLFRLYHEFIKAEYPELATDEQKEALLNEAAGN